MTQRQYPGYGLPLRYVQQGDAEQPPFFPMGAHTNCHGAASEPLIIREVAMMALMDKLTDKPDWHKKVFDSEIVARWREEALTQDETSLYRMIIEGQTEDDLPKPDDRLISEKAFEFCIAELQCKAKRYEETLLVNTLDAGGNTAVKSDTIVGPELKNKLGSAFATLIADQTDSVDWHPRSGDMVQNLVHPSMYPLVYGHSRFLPGDVVGVADSVDNWAGKGEILVNEHMLEAPAVPPSHTYGYGGSNVQPDFWSNKFQWLPSNVTVDGHGKVKLTSYINNLHPTRYSDVYTTIESLVEKAIPAWEHCLRHFKAWDHSASAGHNPPRVTIQCNPDDEEEENWSKRTAEALAASNYQLGDIEMRWLKEGFDMEHEDSEDGFDKEKGLQEAIDDARWKHVRSARLPEPDVYVPQAYAPDVNVRKALRSGKLQIIVKMASIELSPEKLEFPAGAWHVEGQMNEHICATALYYVDSENVTPSHLSFRMQTSFDQEDLHEGVGQDSYTWISRIHGTSFGSASPGMSTCVQNFGNIETCEGRLLAFPNVFQHRVSSFRLKDESKPGHRRFIALWLVDPCLPIISTANVPPQQLDWWANATFGDKAKAKSGDMPAELMGLLLEGKLAAKYPKQKPDELQSRLPAELLDMVRQHGSAVDGLMSLEEAKEYRLQLMDERTRFQLASKNDIEGQYYSFCEH